MDVIAIDWSGRAKGEAETIWLAHMRDGALLALENGRSREEVVAHAIGLVRTQPDAVIGLDFSFSFPRWYCEREGWATAREVWEAMRRDGEGLLARCEPPFWGRPGTTAQTLGEPLRATERALGASSTFQIGGAGSVGTGSIRGMPRLLALADAGIAIWPFHRPQLPLALEIYPRALTGPVVKSRRADRIAHLRARPGLPARAAVSEDAFDAAVSAAVMAERAGELARLPTREPVPIEGEIWRPGVS